MKPRWLLGLSVTTLVAGAVCGQEPRMEEFVVNPSDVTHVKVAFSRTQPTRLEVFLGRDKSKELSIVTKRNIGKKVRFKVQDIVVSEPLVVAELVGPEIFLNPQNTNEAVKLAKLLSRALSPEEKGPGPSVQQLPERSKKEEPGSRIRDKAQDQIKRSKRKPSQDERFETAKAVVEKWLDALEKGDVDILVNLSSVPFAWDGKKLLASEDDLKKRLRTELGDAVKPRQYTWVADTCDVVDKVFPIDCVVLTVANNRNTTLRFCVSLGESPRVIGLDDR